MKKFTVRSMSLILALLLIVTGSFLSYGAELGLSNDKLETRIKSISKRDNVTEVARDSYYLGDVFVCTTQTPNGEFEYAYNDGECIHYAKYLNGVLVEKNVTKNNVISVEATEHQEAALDAIVNNELLSSAQKEQELNKIGYYSVNDENGVSYYLIDNTNKARVSTYTVGMNELKNKYNICYDRMCTSTNFYCSYLGTNKTVYVRESRYSFSELGYKSGTFSKGYSIVKAAVAIYANPTSIISWLGFASTATTFEFDAFIHRSSRAKAVRYKYGEIYDTTAENDYVVAYSVSGYDKYVVSDQGNGYDWGVEPVSFADQYPNSTIANEAANSYNTALDMNGYWPWG